MSASIGHTLANVWPPQRKEEAQAETELGQGFVAEVEARLRELGDLDADAHPELAALLQAQKEEARSLARQIQEGERDVQVANLWTTHGQHRSRVQTDPPVSGRLWGRLCPELPQISSRTTPDRPLIDPESKSAGGPPEVRAEAAPQFSDLDERRRHRHAAESNDEVPSRIS